MKKVIPIIPLIVFIILIEYRLSIIPNLYSLRRDKLKERSNQIQILVLGASDAQADIKPSEFSVPGFTLASANQSYTITAQLIQKYLKELPNLKTILISTSYFIWEHSLKNHPEYWRHFYFSRFMEIPGEVSINHYFDIRNFSLFFLYWPQSLNLVFSIGIPKDKVYSPLQNEGLPFLESIPQDGWMPFNSKAIVSHGLAKIELDRMHSLIKREYTQNNISVMKDALQATMSKKIKPVFIRTPAHPEALKLTRKENIEDEKKNLDAFSNQYGILFVDYSNDSRFKTDDFIDLTHLSAEGAMKFSRILNTEILEK